MARQATTRRRSIISGKTDKGTVFVGDGSKTEPVESANNDVRTRTRTKRRTKRKLNLAAKSAATVCLVAPKQILSNRYHVDNEIARGAMGIVFEGRDSELDDKTIAIKVLPPELTENEEAREQLRSEAMAAMALTHSNIVRLHGYERDGQIVYLIMELIDGPTLEEVLSDRDSLEYSEVVEIARGVCPALDYAHERGVVHRDIKPSNLMIAHEAGLEVVKVTDFGIASRSTQADSIAAGTLLYIAPEQLKNEHIDGKADQYSLAATFYELLSGKPPIEGLGLSRRILAEEPKPLHDIPEWANEALLRALAKNPVDRFDNCQEFMKAFTEAPADFQIPEECLPGTENHHKAGYWNIVAYRIKRQIFSFVLDVAIPAFVATVLGAITIASLAASGPDNVAIAIGTFYGSMVFCYLLLRDLDSGRFSIYKQVFGFKVVNKQLERCEPWRAILRNLFPLFPAVGFLFASGAAMDTIGTALCALMFVEFSLLTYISQTRRMGDLLAGTRIVYEGAIEPSQREAVNERTHTFASLFTLAMVMSLFAALISFYAH